MSLALVTSLSLCLLVSPAQCIAGAPGQLLCRDQPRQFFNPETDNCDDCLPLDNDPLLLASQCRQYAACCVIPDAVTSAGAPSKPEQAVTAPAPTTPSPLPVTTPSAPELNASVVSEVDKPADSTVSSSTIVNIVLPIMFGIIFALLVAIPIWLCRKNRAIDRKRQPPDVDDVERGPLRDGNEEPAAEFSNSLANSASTVGASNPILRARAASGDMNNRPVLQVSDGLIYGDNGEEADRPVPVSAADSNTDVYSSVD